VMQAIAFNHNPDYSLLADQQSPDEVSVEIANDPVVRSLAFRWLDCFVFEEVKDLDSGGAQSCPFLRPLPSVGGCRSPCAAVAAYPA